MFTGRSSINDIKILSKDSNSKNLLLALSSGEMYYFDKVCMKLLCQTAKSKPDSILSAAAKLNHQLILNPIQGPFKQYKLFSMPNSEDYSIYAVVLSDLRDVFIVSHQFGKSNSCEIKWPISNNDRKMASNVLDFAIIDGNLNKNYLALLTPTHINIVELSSLQISTSIRLNGCFGSIKLFKSLSTIIPESSNLIESYLLCVQTVDIVNIQTYLLIMDQSLSKAFITLDLDSTTLDTALFQEISNDIGSSMDIDNDDENSFDNILINVNSKTESWICKLSPNYLRFLSGILNGFRLDTFGTLSKDSGSLDIDTLDFFRPIHSSDLLIANLAGLVAKMDLVKFPQTSTLKANSMMVYDIFSASMNKFTNCADISKALNMLMYVSYPPFGFVSRSISYAVVSKSLQECYYHYHSTF